MITADNLLAHELIGLHIEVVESSAGYLKDLSGTVIQETRNTISIRTGSRTKVIAKNSARKIKVVFSSGSCFISGSSLIGRPEDRISKKSS
jgi:ribonuclease P protein subunit POP4